MKKRWLALLLAVIMTVSLLAVPAGADDSESGRRATFSYGTPDVVDVDKGNDDQGTVQLKIGETGYIQKLPILGYQCKTTKKAFVEFAPLFYEVPEIGGGGAL